MDRHKGRKRIHNQDLTADVIGTSFNSQSNNSDI